MNILCLHWPEGQQHSQHFINELLKISPRLHRRDSHYIFLDISSTIHVHGSVAKVLKKTLALNHSQALSWGGSIPKVAIADTPYHGQLLSQQGENLILDCKKNISIVDTLKVDTLVSFEGLQPWRSVSSILRIIDFCKNVGLFSLGSLRNLAVSSFQERWGKVGQQIWERLNFLESQIISPYRETESRNAYHYFDYPVTQAHDILHTVEGLLAFVLQELAKKSQAIRVLHLHMRCEYSHAEYDLEVEPIVPTRNLDLLLRLIEKKLETYSFENPLRDLDLRIDEAPEPHQQLGLLDALHVQKDLGHWQKLASFAKQEKIQMGFLQRRSAHFPEDSYELVSDLKAASSPSFGLTASSLFSSSSLSSSSSMAGEDPPRPSLLLPHPQPISSHDVLRMKLLSRMPVERLHAKWWTQPIPKERDYYFALSSEGQLLWVFQTHEDQKFYLHGYFD